MPEKNCLIALADSMVKVLPRDNALPVRPANSIELSLARGETESEQVVVLACGEDLHNVRVEFDKLTGPGGTSLPADAVTVRVVGYVETTGSHIPDVYIGWWPDPLLDFLDAITIRDGDAQSFWVSIHAPRDQAPGTYAGRFRVRIGKEIVRELPLSVTVWDIEIPSRPPLPTAIHMDPEYVDAVAGKGAWAKTRDQWASFLADYYISLDRIYGGVETEPFWDVMEKLQKADRLDAFNLGYWEPHRLGMRPEMTPKQRAAAIAKTVERFRGPYQQARERGLLGRAYIYGFDECHGQWNDAMQATGEALKAAYPEVPLMSTASDYLSGGRNVPVVDIWVPQTPYYDAMAKAARSRGKLVWWYVCYAPRPPFANMFIDQPGIAHRQLMGAQAVKYRPDGFLYYYLDHWKNNDAPIESGPFTTWNPRSFGNANGDGSWVCPGPGGRPLATMRLEGFRDGLEDYALAMTFEATYRAVAGLGDSATDAQRAWLERHEKLLKVPESVMQNLMRYSHEPAVLRGWRRSLAEAIESAGIPPVYDVKNGLSH